MWGIGDARELKVRGGALLDVWIGVGKALEVGGGLCELIVRFFGNQ